MSQASPATKDPCTCIARAEHGQRSSPPHATEFSSVQLRHAVRGNSSGLRTSASPKQYNGMKLIRRAVRVRYITPLLMMGCTVVTNPPSEEEQDPELADGTQLTDGEDTAPNADRELNTYLRSLAPLSELGARPPETVACPTSDCGPAIPDAVQGEISCRYDLTTETRTASEELVAAGVDDDLWAGNVLRGLAARVGDLQSVPLPRAPRTLSASLVGTAPVQLDAPSNSAYQVAVGQILAGREEPTGSAVASHISTTSLFSRESLSTALGIDVGFSLLGSLGTSLGVEARSNIEHHTARVAVTFVQSYYKIVADAPTGPAQFFAEGVSADDVATVLGVGDVPVYVRSVTYGRRILAVFEDESRTSDDGLKAEVSAKFGTETADASLPIDDSTEVRHSRFSAVVLGDDTVFTTLDELVDYLKRPADVTTAWPIGYSLNYVSDDRPFEVARTLELVTRACEACGSNDPSESNEAGIAGTIVKEVPMGDLDSESWSPEPALLLSSEDEDWYTFRGIDQSGVVDPQASVTSEGLVEVCLFVDCLSGTPDPQCLSGDLVVEGTQTGCCGMNGDAQLEGATLSGLCLNGSDDADVSVRVRTPGPDQVACVPYTITMHY